MASEDAKKAAQKHVDARLAPMMRALKIVRETNDKGRQALKAWADSKTRPAPAATDTGLVTVGFQCSSNAVEWCETLIPKVREQHGYKIRELVTRSQAEAIIAAQAEHIATLESSLEAMEKRAEKAEADNAALTATVERLRDSSAPMACDPDEWLAAEGVLAHLLINVVGVPDDVPYSPNEAQEIIERQLKRVQELDDIEEMLMEPQEEGTGPQILPDFEPDWTTLGKVEACLHLLEKRSDVIEGCLSNNAAQAARVKELQLIRDSHSQDTLQALLEKQALEAKLAAAEKALEPFSYIAGELFSANFNDDDVVFKLHRKTAKGSKLSYQLTAKAFFEARAVLGGKP